MAPSLAVHFAACALTAYFRPFATLHSANPNLSDICKKAARLRSDGTQPNRRFARISEIALPDATARRRHVDSQLLPPRKRSAPASIPQNILTMRMKIPQSAIPNSRESSRLHRRKLARTAATVRRSIRCLINVHNKQKSKEEPIAL